MNPTPRIDSNFREFLGGWIRSAETPPNQTLNATGLDRDTACELMESQMLCRHLDLAARQMRTVKTGYYTISSAGHEGNVVLGRLTRHTDPAFLHYRSGALFLERARQVADVDPVRDTLLSLAAASEDPIAGGRHKVWGSRPLWVLPQTSTVASHLPKALGTAIALERTKRMGLTPPVPDDAIVLCSFGDASLNHSTASGALNAAAWCQFQGIPAPIVFLCEDNGIGISVPTPPGWVEAISSNRRGLRYYRTDGLDLADAYTVAREAIDDCRQTRAPVFLHMEVVRLLGHAGGDMESTYRSTEAIESSERQDPLLQSARLLLEAGYMSAAELARRYDDTGERVRRQAEWAGGRPRLKKAADVIAPLAPLNRDAVIQEAERCDFQAARASAFDGSENLPENGPAKNMGAQINRALRDALAKYPRSVVFGEDVARKGGVYGITRGLARDFGSQRVFDTLLDEQSILGMAQGCGYMGLLPIPEIQYLAFFHNAADQLRGEACSTQFFSRGQFRNPMVVRMPGLGYQQGFGGHFHNDNAITALRDIPGLVIACPGRGDDAAAMLRTCLAMAELDGQVVVFLEPIALYPTRDLYEPNDGQWLTTYPAPAVVVEPGEPRIYHPEQSDVLIISFANGCYLSLRAAHRFREETGIGVRVMDLRWLKPLNEERIAEEARQCQHVLIVDEGRRNGGLGEALVTILAERLETLPPLERITGADSYIPLGPASACVLPSEEEIVEALRRLTDS